MIVGFRPGFKGTEVAVGFEDDEGMVEFEDDERMVELDNELETVGKPVIVLVTTLVGAVMMVNLGEKLISASVDPKPILIV